MDRLGRARCGLYEPRTVDVFAANLRRAAEEVSFVSARAKRAWLDYMVDHFLVAQCPGESGQHVMLVLTQSALQAFLSVRHSVLENALVTRFQGSLAPHLSKNVLSPVKHADQCAMLACTPDGELGSTAAAAAMLTYRRASDLNCGAEPRNLRFASPPGEARRALAEAVARELLGDGGLALSPCAALEWRLDAHRCFEANLWPSEVATLWNHARGGECFALATARPLALTLYVSAEPRQWPALLTRLYAPPPATSAARSAAAAGGLSREEAQARAEFYALTRFLADAELGAEEEAAALALGSLGAAAAALPEAAARVLLRQLWFPALWALPVTGVPGIASAWPAHYTCQVSRAEGETRRWCVKTRGAAFRATHRGYGTVPGARGGRRAATLDADTLATDDLSASGMQLLGVDTAVAYMCHPEVARANDTFPEHLFFLGMLLSHTGVLTNVSGKGYVKLGSDFAAQVRARATHRGANPSHFSDLGGGHPERAAAGGARGGAERAAAVAGRGG